eukprot:365195-Chlamydomonas_euryale.AAC.7
MTCPSPPRRRHTHAQFKVMVAALTGVYMVHCKHLDRMRPFIEAGGLKLSGWLAGWLIGWLVGWLQVVRRHARLWLCPSTEG